MPIHYAVVSITKITRCDAHNTSCFDTYQEAVEHANKQAKADTTKVFVVCNLTPILDVSGVPQQVLVSSCNHREV